MGPEEALIRVVAAEVVDQAKEGFSKVVEKEIRLHYAETRRTEEIFMEEKIDEKIAQHADFCEVAQLLKITKTKVLVAGALLMFVSGSSAEIMRKIFEWLNQSL